MTPEEERQHLTRQLQECAQGTIAEWMRLPVLEDVAGIEMQVRVRWQDDGTALVETSQYAEDLGRFRFTVTVEDLGLLPPIGPENDGAAQAEMAEGPAQRYEPCMVWELRTMRDVRGGDVIRMPGSESSERVVDMISPVIQHHMHPAGQRYEPKPAEWTSVNVTLNGNTYSFDPALPVEIELEESELVVIESLGWENRIHALK